MVSDGFKRLTRRHSLVLPVCHKCHRTGPQAIHTIGHGPWNELHGIDQVAAADALFAEHGGAPR
ncbi:hypothetical protein SAMN05192583_0596 [Sphingomonas gellani]|uniref:Uncharacterized protein n=1 Tax=Sphingomonas gellani TaxID=1166340 RepID=A0A1H7ZAV5_9SPHN|nr:hypothetical protein SAMN05192583_0596 [Sphingomonas gellani]